MCRLYVNPHNKGIYLQPTLSLCVHFICHKKFPNFLLHWFIALNSADAASAITKLVHRLQSISPNAPHCVLGDFNTCSLKKHLGHLHQYVSCPTRHGEILDERCL